MDKDMDLMENSNSIDNNVKNHNTYNYNNDYSNNINGKNDNFVFVTDIAATITDIVYNDVDERIIGKSLIDALAGSSEKIYKDSEAIGLEVTGNSALFKGDFKIVRNRPPNGTNEWELYNILEDPGETLNLADELPEKLEELVNDYRNYSLANGVIELPPDYNWAEEMTKNTFKRHFFTLLIWVVMAIAIITIITAYIFRKK